VNSNKAAPSSSPPSRTLKLSCLEKPDSQTDRKDSSIQDSPVQNPLSTLSVTPVLKKFKAGKSPEGFIFRYDDSDELKDCGEGNDTLASRGFAHNRRNIPARFQEKCMRSCHETDSNPSRVEKSRVAQDCSTDLQVEDLEPALQTFKQRLASLTLVCGGSPQPQYRFRVGMLGSQLFRSRHW